MFFIIVFFKHCKVDHVDSTILFSLCEVDFLFPGFRAIANVVQFQRFVVFSLQCWLFDSNVSVFFKFVSNAVKSIMLRSLFFFTFLGRLLFSGF